MFNRYPSRTQCSLQLWNVEPEDRHDERKEDGGEDVEVLRGFVEARGMLKNG